jgi:uncharacterized protein YjbI with pentapeptide repeats
MESINTVFIIAAVISTFILVLLQWFIRRDSKDKKILRRPPYTEPLPQHDIEIASKEWQSWKNKYQNMPPHEKSRLQNEYVKRERNFFEERDTFLEAQKPYQVACEELEICWRNFRDVFNNLGFFQRWFAGETSRDLARLRQVYLDVEQKVKWERDKWYSRKRIKKIEETASLTETAEQQVTEEHLSLPEETTEQENRPLPTDEVPETVDLPDKQTNPEEEFHHSLVETPSSDLSAEDLEPIEEEVELNVHFTQEDLKEFYPDYRNKTYIDEVFMPDPFYAGTMKNADFVKAKFVGVQFKGIHQYQKCRFQGADFSAAVFHPGKKPHRFLYCNFTKSKWSGAQLMVAAFYLCKFKGVRFRTLELTKVKFVQCDLTEADLKGADFSKCVMSRDMLEVIDFTECEHPPANFSTITQETDASNNTEEDSAQEISQSEESEDNESSIPQEDSLESENPETSKIETSEDFDGMISMDELLEEENTDPPPDAKE